MKFIQTLILGAFTMVLSACNSHMPTFKSFSGQEPKLDMKSYFNGPMEAWGFIQGRDGEVTRRFRVDILGSWDGNTGTLKEHFVFDDGEKQDRTWTLNLNNDGTFTGSAHDVIGEARGKIDGNALNMKYVLRIPVDGKKYDIKINDWLIQLDEKRLINISELTKFGFTVGRLTIYFEKK